MNATAERVEPLRLSDFQADVLRVPESADLFLGGGRGGGKSYAVAAMIVRHCAERAAFASVLYVRQSFPGAGDFDAILRELLPLAFPGATYNSQAHVWRLPNGARVELGVLAGPDDLTRFQGRSFTLLCIDEAGEWPDLALAERLRANLRGPAGMPLRVVFAANPGGPGHATLYRRFVSGRAPWLPFTEESSGRAFVYCPSTYRENPYIDAERYAANLSASCAGDPELLKAWRDGSWAIARGAFFGAVLDERKAALDAKLWTPANFAKLRASVASREPGVDSDNPFHWRPDNGERAVGAPYLAHDFGAAAPSVTFVCAESNGFIGPDGRFYSRGSILLLDEVATNEPDSLTKGAGYTVPDLAEMVKELAARWSMPPQGVADDAIFAKTGSGAGSIADEFRRSGVYFTAAQKGARIAGWSLMRSMLDACGAPDVPALYVSRACSYWWATVPTLPRDPRRIDDVDTRGADHAADACRYALARQVGSATYSAAGFIGF